MNMYRKSHFVYMKWLMCIFLFVLSSCDDRYRYYCQDPKHFSAKRCQRPDCQFTQDCPDYLVAPILEKQVVQPSQIPSQSASDARGN
jgi:hypothetical protein